MWLVIDHKKQPTTQSEENEGGFLLDEDRQEEEYDEISQQQPSNQQDTLSPTDYDESYFCINQEDYDSNYIDLRDRLIDCYLNDKTVMDTALNNNSLKNNINEGLTPSS